MQLPSAVNNFKTKQLNEWVNADTAWMDMRAWDGCQPPRLIPGSGSSTPFHQRSAVPKYGASPSALLRAACAAIPMSCIQYNGDNMNHQMGTLRGSMLFMRPALPQTPARVNIGRVRHGNR